MKLDLISRKGTELRRSAGVLALLGALVVGLAAGPYVSHSASAAQDNVRQVALPSPAQLSSEFSKVTKQVAPAVVNINTESTIRMTSRRQMPGQGRDEDPFGGFFERFFGPNMGPNMPDLTPDVPGAPQENFKQRSLGSGVIIDPAGYILTNNHVVGRADRIRVKIQDDPKQYDAKVIGTDRETDLAVIKVDAGKQLPYARLGNSEGLTVGDWVLAIGSPFGLEETVTAGIISAQGRDLGSPFQRFLQTDAAINPGNSGGPLVNMAGEVIGINTQIASDSGSSAGVGFAVPSNTAIDVYNQITKSGKVTRGSIGITYQTEQNPALLRSFGADHGVVVTSVRPDGPAGKAGLKQGDVLVAINGKELKGADELVSMIASLPVGQNATFKYIRDRKEHQTSVMIGDRTEVLAGYMGEDDAEQTPEQHEDAKAKIGISVQNLTPTMARQMGMEGTSGVVVSNVVDSSFAEEVGLRSGDVITEINQQKVANVNDLRRIQETLKSGSDVVFLVQRSQGGRTAPIYLAGTLS